MSDETYTAATQKARISDLAQQLEQAEQRNKEIHAQLNAASDYEALLRDENDSLRQRIEELGRRPQVCYCEWNDAPIPQRLDTNPECGIHGQGGLTIEELT